MEHMYWNQEGTPPLAFRQSIEGLPPWGVIWISRALTHWQDKLLEGHSPTDSRIQGGRARSSRWQPGPKRSRRCRRSRGGESSSS